MATNTLLPSHCNYFIQAIHILCFLFVCFTVLLNGAIVPEQLWTSFLSLYLDYVSLSKLWQEKKKKKQEQIIVNEVVHNNASVDNQDI